MSGGAALTLGGGGKKGGGGIFGGIGPGGKKVGILAGVGSASDCSAITCTTTERRGWHDSTLRLVSCDCSSVRASAKFSPEEKKK